MGSTVQLRSRVTSTGDRQSEYDAATAETVTRYTAVTFEDDFAGPGYSAALPTSATSGFPWIKKTVQTGGTPSVAVVSNSPGGLLRLALDATSEKQEASLYAADVLNWDITKSAVWEARIANHVVPTGVVAMVFGLQTAWIDGPDNAARYVEFQQSASGVINIRSKDGTNTLTFATTVTMAVDVFHVFRIDATDPTNVRFFIDGTEVSTSGQLSFAATGSNAVLQPYASVYKASGTGVGTLDIDMIQLGMNRA